MSKRRKAIIFVTSMVTSWLILCAIWYLVFLILPSPELTLAQGLLIIFMPPLVLAAFLPVLRLALFRHHREVFICIKRGCLGCVLLAFTYGIIISIFPSEADEEYYLQEDPNYDPDNIITGDELKSQRMVRLPKDIDRLRVTASYPRDDPNSQEVYFEYVSPTLYSELDNLLEFRTVNQSLFSDYWGSPALAPTATVYFFRGDERCEAFWHHVGGRFFYPGLLTKKSEKKLLKWFESNGFQKFSEWRHSFESRGANKGLKSDGLEAAA